MTVLKTSLIRDIRTRVAKQGVIAIVAAERIVATVAHQVVVAQTACQNIGPLVRNSHVLSVAMELVRAVARPAPAGAPASRPWQADEGNGSSPRASAHRLLPSGRGGL